MYERFTDRARKVMMLAHQDALRRRAAAIDTEHILLGLLEEGQGVAAHVLSGLGVDWESVAAALAVRGLPYPPPPPASDAPEERPLSAWQLTSSRLVRQFLGSRADKLPRTAESNRLIECAMQEARALGHNYVGTEHLLLGLLRQPNTLAAQLLEEQGLTLDGVRREVLELLGHA